MTNCSCGVGSLTMMVGGTHAHDCTIYDDELCEGGCGRTATYMNAYGRVTCVECRDVTGPILASEVIPDA